MKSEPYSISVRSLSLTPRDSSASVKTPVPGPSSRTGPEAGVISLVIRLARLAPEGAIAPTLRGLNARERKNNKTSCIAMKFVIHIVNRLRRPMPEWTPYEGSTLSKHCVSQQKRKNFRYGERQQLVGQKSCLRRT
jgi:hypothetical protein